jgi:putative transposase
VSRRTGEPTESEDQALTRYRLLLPHLQGDVPLTRIAAQANVSQRTAQRWLERFRKQGFAGLRAQQRKDAGLRRAVREELQYVIEGLYLHRPAPSISSIHRRIKTVCQQKQWHSPSYKTVHSIIKKLEPALVTLAQEGSKKYKEIFDLVLRREAERPNQIWQADHTELDILIIDESGKPARPWLTVVLDDFSRAISGYYVTLDAPSAIGTALALRQAICPKLDPRWTICGIPEQFYTDHGSDFTSNHLEQISAELKMSTIFSTIGQPRGRGKQERFFQTVNQLFLSELPGYLASGAKNPKPTLTLEELDKAFCDWLLDDYMRREHSELGCTPYAKWENTGFIPRLPDSIEQLDLLLLTVTKTRKVQRDGIYFIGMRYTDTALAAFVGESIVIRYNPRDLAELKVYLNDEFICTAVCHEIANTTVSLKGLIKARNHRRKMLEREINARSEIVRLYMEPSRFRPSEQDSQQDPSASSLGAGDSHKPARLKLYAADFTAKKAKTRTISRNV